MKERINQNIKNSRIFRILTINPHGFGPNNNEKYYQLFYNTFRRGLKIEQVSMKPICKNGREGSKHRIVRLER